MPEQIDTRGLSRNSIRNLCIVLRFLLPSFVKSTSRLMRGVSGKICERRDARTRLVFSRDNLRREREEEVRIKSRENMAITRRLILKFVWWRKYVAAKGGGVGRATKEGANLLEPGQNAPPAGCKPLGLVMIQSSVKPAAAGLDRVAHVNCTIRGVTFSGYVYPRNPTSTVHLPAPRPLN